MTTQRRNRIGPEDVQERKERFAIELESQAEFRRRKAEEYPEDGRNEMAARDFDAAATYVSGLPVADPLLVRLVAVEHAMRDDAELAEKMIETEQSFYSLGRWNTAPGGIARGPIPPATFISELVSVLEHELAARQ